MNARLSLRTASLLIVAAVSLVLLKLIDLAALAFLWPPPLFPPMERAHYKSVDYDAIASINKFGFRGKETSLEKEQIIAIGDSFTFGFGNNDDEVWPRLLEAKLAGNKMNKKVYNLGVPGTDTLFHIDVARAYVESLKPAVVILSILISDDFQQVYESANFDKEGTKATVVSNLKNWFPGIDRMLKAMRNAAGRIKQKKRV